MQNEQRMLTEHGRPGGLAAVGADVAAAHRGTSIMFDRRGSGMVREVVEDDPASLAGLPGSSLGLPSGRPWQLAATWRTCRGHGASSTSPPGP